jgi:hypothetical protein
MVPDRFSSDLAVIRNKEKVGVAVEQDETSVVKLSYFSAFSV